MFGNKPDTVILFFLFYREMFDVVAVESPWRIWYVCLTKSNKFPLTFSLLFTLYMYKKKNFFFIEDRINSFVPFIRSSCLRTLLDRSTCCIQGLHQASRITHSFSSSSSASFFSLSLSLDLLRPTIERVCMCHAKAIVEYCIFLHHSSAYKGLLFHYLRSQEKLIDDDVKSDISNSIKS